MANSQAGELEKFLKDGYEQGKSPVTFRRYTGQENQAERDDIINNPPDVILTNYVMLERRAQAPGAGTGRSAARSLDGVTDLSL